MKHVPFCMLALLSCITSLSAQVKKTYQDQNHKNQTVVVKSAETDNDLEILDAQFDIEKFKVGEVVKITTEKSVQINKNKSSKDALVVSRKSIFKRDKHSNTGFKGNSLSTKRKNKKPKMVFNDPPKRKGGKDFSKKCYKFK